MDIPEQYHGRGFGVGLSEDAVQVAVEGYADAVFQNCMGQNRVVGRGTQAGVAYVNDIKPTCAEQRCELGRQVLVKKQPKN